VVVVRHGRVLGRENRLTPALCTWKPPFCAEPELPISVYENYEESYASV
jgi:hypothetical protein